MTFKRTRKSNERKFTEFCDFLGGKIERDDEFDFVILRCNNIPERVTNVVVDPTGSPGGVSIYDEKVHEVKGITLYASMSNGKTKLVDLVPELKRGASKSVDSLGFANIDFEKKPEGDELQAVMTDPEQVSFSISREDKPIERFPAKKQRISLTSKLGK